MKKGSLPEPGRRRNSGIEWEYVCPLCGSSDNNKFPLGVNIQTGEFNCFRCGYHGVIDNLVMDVPELPEVEYTHADVGPVPKYLHTLIEERGFLPSWLEQRYLMGWDGTRLCFPDSETSYWRRAVFSWQEPKVKFRGEKGLLGSHLIEVGSYVVLCEGDFKAASIPLPWVGVGLGGTSITNHQVDLLAYLKPAFTVVMLDGGVDPGPVCRKLSAKLLKCASIEGLPEAQGPDDIPRHELVAMLGGVELW